MNVESERCAYCKISLVQGPLRRDMFGAPVCALCPDLYPAAPDSHPIPEPAPKRGIDPKQGAGAQKVPFAALPWSVVAEAAVGLGEGAEKYGRHNYRKTEVLTSTYYSAAMRHLVSWFEGEDVDPDSGLPHITKAICSLMVVRDAQIQGTACDDRPNASPANFMADLNAATVEMTARLIALNGDTE